MADSTFRLEYHVQTAVEIEKIKKLISLRDEKGYVVEGDSVTEWYFTGFVEKNKKHYLYGVTGALISLEKKIEGNRKTALKAMLTLIQALQVLEKDSKRQYEVSLDTVYFTQTNGVLFLPAAVIRKLKDAGTDDFKKKIHQISNPYYNKQNERAIFAVEALLFYILTGNFPFTGKTDDDLRNNLRNMNIPSPKSFLPEMKPDVARQFEVFFNTKNQCTETLVRLEKKVTLWILEDVTQTILPQEREAILNEANKAQGSRERILKRKMFWEKNGRTIFISIIAGVVGSALLLSFLSIYFQPRKTKGFLPEKIVETYYQSITSLDSSLLLDCYINGAGQKMQSLLDNIFPLDRQHEAMSGYPLVVPADKWVADGMPKLKRNQFALGIVHLEFKKETDIPEPIYLAEYDFYIRDSHPDKPDDEKMYYVVSHIRERLSFTQDGEDWVIYKIEQFENTVVKIFEYEQYTF